MIFRPFLPNSPIVPSTPQTLYIDTRAKLKNEVLRIPAISLIAENGSENAEKFLKFWSKNFLF